MSFLSKFVQMLLQICTTIEIFATCRAAGCLFGSRQYWWIRGMPFDSYRLPWGGAGSSEPGMELGIEWHKTLWVCLKQYKSPAKSHSYKENLQGAPWEALLFTLLIPHCNHTIKTKEWNLMSTTAVFSISIPSDWEALKKIRSQILYSFGRFETVITHALLLWVEKWFDDFQNSWPSKN